MQSQLRFLEASEMNDNNLLIKLILLMLLKSNVSIHLLAAAGPVIERAEIEVQFGDKAAEKIIKVINVSEEEEILEDKTVLMKLRKILIPGLNATSSSSSSSSSSLSSMSSSSSSHRKSKMVDVTDPINKTSKRMRSSSSNLHSVSSSSHSSSSRSSSSSRANSMSKVWQLHC